MMPYEEELSRDSLMDDELFLNCFEATMEVNSRNDTILHSSSGRDYKLLKTLKKTIFGSVVQARLVVPGSSASLSAAAEVKSLSQYVAVKIYSRELIDKCRQNGRCKEDPVNELEISKILSNRHPHLVGSIECCTDEDFVYHIMPYIHEPELFDFLVSHDRLDERLTRKIVQQAISSLIFLHDMGIAHRDLSLENMLFNPETEHMHLIDFGLSVMVDLGDNVSSQKQVPNIFTGKISYLAPEVINGNPMVDPFALDIWALGICTMYLLLGFPPLMKADASDLRYVYLERGQLRDLVSQWQVPVPELALDFAEKLLTVNPAQRPTIHAVLRHPWLASSE